MTGKSNKSLVCIRRNHNVTAPVEVSQIDYFESGIDIIITNALVYAQLHI